MRRLVQCVTIALAVLLLSSSPATAVDLEPAAHPQSSRDSGERPLCIPLFGLCEDGPFCASDIPEEHCKAAAFVYEFVLSHNYSPPPGYKGGSAYNNETGLLPPGGDYLEYRIYTTPGSAERLVFDRKRSAPDNAWFSGDHYASFQQFYLLVLA